MKIINTLLRWGEAKLVLILSTSVLVLVFLVLVPKMQFFYRFINSLSAGLN
ncbi:MAG: hypothetical protein UR60_C0021G0028 [Candidatus Moranbacteria bacterium GW2011_GWF2_34_56]|nr:MAG: hypothetical protein UR51_C0008G0005 [Candidatus Moranbacteria bacterium GW2011_GWF1_34_10]KKP64460.1 MAG: hypothetical protein UR60_C0021G0028 [Candidatus Moranbacteria bacterium GW2011_GWF2_34_56]